MSDATGWMAAHALTMCAIAAVLQAYFHGDNGAGLGAAHQTGWTGLVADMIRRHLRPALVRIIPIG